MPTSTWMAATTMTTVRRSHLLTSSKVRISEGTCCLSFLFKLYIDEGAAHMLELSKLAEKDPEFYRYLQEHDRELLEFNVGDDGHIDDDDADGADDGDAGQLPVLTENKLRTWQKSLLEVGTSRWAEKRRVALMLCSRRRDPCARCASSWSHSVLPFS